MTRAGALRAALAVAGAAWLGAAGPAAPLNLNDYMLGNWARQDGQTRIHVARCGGGICAVNTWVRDPGGDEHVGDTLRMALAQESPAELSGSAHDDRRDMDFHMRILFTGHDMRTSGCVLLGLVCRSAEWTRTP